MTATLLRRGTELPLLEPGSPEWLGCMSASKISAVIGLNNWESLFTIWHRMAGNLENDETDAHRRGHFLEPAICAWFASQHPDLTVTTTGSWAHPDNPLFVASPDRLATDPDGNVFCVEAKSDAGDGDAWGKPGTDEVPAGYRAQATWEMGCVGATRTYLPMIGPYLSFAEYVIEFDQAEFDFLAGKALAFLDTLPGGPAFAMPALDDTSATYEAVRKLHPEIDGTDVEIAVEIAERFEAAYDAWDLADAEKTGAKTALLDAMGQAKNALMAGQKFAYRKPGRSVSLCRVKKPTRT